MRLSVLVPFALFACINLHAAEPPNSLAKVSTASVARGQPLPAWAEPLLSIPPSTSGDALVQRLSETQVWTGSGPTAILYNRAIQINHRAGLGEIGQFALSFLPSHQSLSLHRVAILRGDAVLDRTATVDARLLERESELDNGTYGGETTVQLLLDDVRVGDTLWVTYTITGDNPVFGTHWGNMFQWDSNWPVMQRSLTISHPAGKPLFWRQLGDVPAPALKPVIERAGAIERLRFAGRDIAPVQLENKMPTGFIPVRIVQFSDFASWQDVAQWAGALFPARAPSPEVAALAAQFRTAGGPAAQAGAALRWIQDEVRYFSVSIGENSHRPQLPETVLARRYGDCKDKTYLLVSVLQALGIQAEPVLLNARAPGYPAKLQPTQNAFDHAIVRLHIDGKTYVVDPTETGQRGALDQLAPAYPGAAVLVVAGATRALTVLPDPAPAAPSYERIELFKVADFNGAATLASRDIYRAERAVDARRKFAIMRPVEVANDVLEHYERQYPGVTLLGAPTLVDDAPDGSFEVRARLALPKAVRKVEERYVLDYESQLADGTLGLPDKLVRQFPFRFAGGRVDARYRMKVQWPAAVRARHPGAVKLVDDPYFSVRESYSMLGNEVDYLLDYRLKRDDVAAADLPRLHVALRGTQGMLSGAFNYSGGEDDAATRDLSMRGYAAAQQLQGMRDARAEETVAQIGAWNVDALCWHLRNAGATLALQPDDERAATRTQRDAFAHDVRPGADACRAQLSLQDGDARASADWFAKETALHADDRVRLQWSWARWYAGQRDAALALAMDYIVAARASGELNGSDLALAISLHVRAGKPVPALLATTFVLPADGPWPAPLLAWQRGTLSEAALLKTIDGYVPDARALARNDAWFHIGQRRFAGGDKAGAAAALRWYQVDGVRATVPFVLAGLEQDSSLRDPDLQAGSAAWERHADTDAIAAWGKAAQRGNVEAQSWLGRAYAMGRGVAKDPAVARRILEPAAQAGSGRALYVLALLDLDSVNGDRARGMAYLRQSVATGYPNALLHLSLLYERGAETPPDAAPDAKNAAELERQAAEMDNSAAQAVHAFRYVHGNQVPRNDALARYWAERAILNGDDAGYAALARVLMRGNADDQRTAVGMVRTLADAGEVHAMLVMAHAAMRGIGQPVDRVAGRTWFVGALKKSGRDSLGQFSSMMGEWGGDQEDAFDGMRLAAEDGEAEAQASLSWKYRAGLGTPVDLAASVRWLQAAVKQGNLTAINNLGDAYETGTGVAPDIVRAVALYGEAAQRGSIAAFGSLASVHEKGVGTRVDLPLAYAYLLLRHRYRDAARPGIEVDARTLAMAGKLSAPELAQARAVADAWQPGQALPR
jgi:TPR repeat protein